VRQRVTSVGRFQLDIEEPGTGVSVGRTQERGGAAKTIRMRPPLYTPEERMRRDKTPWTLVQGILAPIQFLVCLISASLVIRYLVTGDGLRAANISVILKTILLLTIMVTGSIWEKVVFDKWLFAPAFFWEDVVSFGVIALHLIYIVGLLTGSLPSRALMFTALAAYSAYIVNAIQFILKLRAARLQEAMIKSAATSNTQIGAMA
jgi:3-vinyl bacteriochlorophyllide hydratase